MSLDLTSTTELLRILGDANRMRLLWLLGEEELTVAELVEVTRLTQSRVSSHLSRLRDAGFIVDRRSGASTYYRLNEEGMPPPARRSLQFAHDIARDPLFDADHARLEVVLAARGGGETWADSVAGQMDRHYSPGRTWEATAWGVLGFARLGDVLDLASGDGVLAQLLSPRARSVTCLDKSEKVVEAGRRRLGHLENVRFQRGDMHDLPFEAESFDQATLMNALTYSTEPSHVFAELARVLRPNGQLVGVTLHRHEHQASIERFNHVQLGFDPGALERMLSAHGFAVDLCQVTCREQRRPYFEVITLHARRAGANRNGRTQ